MHRHFSLILCCGGFLLLLPVSSAQRDEARRVEVQCRASAKEGALSLVLIVQATTEEVLRSYFKPRHKPRLRDLPLLYVISIRILGLSRKLYRSASVILPYRAHQAPAWLPINQLVRARSTPTSSSTPRSKDGKYQTDPSLGKCR